MRAFTARYTVRRSRVPKQWSNGLLEAYPAVSEAARVRIWRSSARPLFELDARMLQYQTRQDAARRVLHAIENPPRRVAGNCALASCKDTSNQASGKAGLLAALTMAGPSAEPLKKASNRPCDRRPIENWASARRAAAKKSTSCPSCICCSFCVAAGRAHTHSSQNAAAPPARHSAHEDTMIQDASLDRRVPAFAALPPRRRRAHRPPPQARAGSSAP